MNNNNNLPVIFNYQGKQVRSIKINGELWLVAKDVCDILEIQNASRAVQEELDDDEKGIRNVYTPGGMQNMTVINEPGLYKLTFRSRKPKAKEFTRWVTHDVLPEIRKTGCYTDPALKVATETAKPVFAQPVPKDIKIYLSKANFSAQEKIIDKAIEAYYLVKNNEPNADKECQKVLALDFAFKKRTGYSALEAAGIRIEQDTNGQAVTEWNWIRINWVTHFKVYFSDSRLELPEPREEEHALPE